MVADGAVKVTRSEIRHRHQRVELRPTTTKPLAYGFHRRSPAICGPSALVPLFGKAVVSAAHCAAELAERFQRAFRAQAQRA
jgi:hypothetical protein